MNKKEKKRYEKKLKEYFRVMKFFMVLNGAVMSASIFGWKNFNSSSRPFFEFSMICGLLCIFIIVILLFLYFLEINRINK